MKTTKTIVTQICGLNKLLKHRLYAICMRIWPKIQVLVCIAETEDMNLILRSDPTVAKDTDARMAKDTGPCVHC